MFIFLILLLTSCEDYKNRLYLQESTYLKSLKNDPVWWKSWDFLRKNNFKKPLFISIGHNSCSSCLKMEKNVFRDQEVADFLNKNFINIKVDREELPQVDKYFMNALIMMGSRGGWPISVLAVNRKNPFWAGGYFNKSGFLKMMKLSLKYWKEDRKKIEDTAANMSRILTEENRKFYTLKKTLNLSKNIQDHWADEIFKSYDEDFGGFGKAPKFLGHNKISFLISLINKKHPESKNIYEMLDFTFQKMIFGGVYDHLEGGIYRYSKDSRWYMPVLEKTLYDQLLFSFNLIKFYEIQKDEFYKSMAQEVLDYVLDYFQDNRGGFYSTYLISQEHLKRNSFWKKKLKSKDFELVSSVYSLSSPHVFVKNIPLFKQKVNKLVEIKKSIISFSNQFEKDLPDIKIITGWNGLAIKVLARAGKVFNDQRYIKAAYRTAERVYKGNNKKLNRSFTKTWHGDSVLEDHAYLIFGLLELYKIDKQKKWLNWAKDIQKVQNKYYWNEKYGSYYYDLSYKTMDILDDSKPNANAISLGNLKELTRLGEDHTSYINKLINTFQHKVPNYAKALSSGLEAMLN